MNPATQGTNATPRLRSHPRSAAGASVCPPGCPADPGVRPPRPDWLPLIAPLRVLTDISYSGSGGEPAAPLRSPLISVTSSGGAVDFGSAAATARVGGRPQS